MSYTPCQCYTVTHKYTIGHFDEWLTIHQVLPYKLLSLNVSPLKPTINCQSFTCQTFVLYGNSYKSLPLMSYAASLIKDSGGVLCRMPCKNPNREYLLECFDQVK